ncbi:MAG: NnrU family protein, partial [Burkholderiales bacterium]
LVLGLVLFLGTHSVRVFADDWRGAQLAARGEKTWKGLYSVLSLAGLVLIVYGYGLTRQAPIDIWNPPVWTRHLAALLTLPAFVLLAAGQMTGTRIKSAVGHPMVLGTKVWAFSHLIANGRLGDVVLFGAFLVWSIMLYAASRRRDRRNGVRYVAGPASRDVIAVVAGLVAWAAFAFFLHAWLIGVQPFG